MVLFARLRQRWHKRRFERKLRELGGRPPRGGSSSTHKEHIVTVPVAIQPVIKSKETVLELAAETSHSTSGPRSKRGARHRAPSESAPLDAAVVAFLREFHALRKLQFAHELATLRGLECALPAIKHDVDKCAEWHLLCQHTTYRTDRDVDRWMHHQTQLNSELVRICDLAASARRLYLRPTHANWIDCEPQEKRTRSTAAATTLDRMLPSPEIWLAMVLLALLTGVYGIVLLAVLFKTQGMI